MSKKYSASKFRFSLACNSPWPTELPLEKGLCAWGERPGADRGQEGLWPEGLPMGKTRKWVPCSSLICHLSFHFCSLLHEQRCVSFPREYWEFWRKGVLGLDGAGPRSHSQTSSPWTRALLTNLDDAERPPWVTGSPNLVTVGRWLCAIVPSPCHVREEAVALTWKVLGHSIPMATQSCAMLSLLLKISY